MNKAVLVIGGTGKTGAPLVQRLREEGVFVRAASRSGQAPSGTEGVVFDWADPSTHAAALEGISSVYLMAPLGEHNPVPIVEPFVKQALAAGARRFVLLSSSLIEEGGPAQGLLHKMLREMVPEWTSLRPSWFMQNFINEPHLSSIRDEGRIYSATENGRVPFIAAEDIAEVALRLLTGDQQPPNELILTGPAAISYDDVAGIIARVRGRPVEHVRLSVEELAARHEKFGIPADFAQLLAGLDGLIASGAEARTTSAVSEISGREATGFEEFANRSAVCWQ